MLTTTPAISQDSETVEAQTGVGNVIITVPEHEGKHYASITDAQEVIDAILTKEQHQAVLDGATIEIVVDVKPIDNKEIEEDRDVIDKGIDAFSKDFPGLTLGCYYDISLLMRVGDGEWQNITSLNKPIDIVIEIPEELYIEGAIYHIIRAHDGNYLLLEDRDDNDRTITISSQFYSTYAITYQIMEEKCKLCGVCAHPFGICIWLWMVAGITMCAFVTVIYIRRQKKKKKEIQK